MTVAWVTGAAGFIGGHLTRHLAERGVHVGGLDLIEPHDRGASPIDWQIGPLSPEGMAALSGRCGTPDAIYHLAGGSSVGASLGDPRGDFEATVGGTVILLDWLRRHAPSAALVVASSAAVYGDLHAGQIDEDAATAPFSPYGAHKFAMEAICRGWAGSLGLRIVAVRLFSVYGPGLAKQLLWDLCGKLSAGPVATLGGTGAELRDWTHIDDVVRALVAAAPLASSAMPVINAGTGRAGSVRSVAELVARAFGREPDCVTFSGDSRPGDPFSLVAAPGTLARRGFDWHTDVDRGIADYVRWYRARTGS